MIDADIREASLKLVDGFRYTPLLVVCTLLGIPVPEGLAPEAGRFDDRAGLNGGDIGRTYAQQWASQEILGREGAEKRVCEWLFILTGVITQEQFRAWAQCLRNRCWPWANNEMDQEAREAMDNFRFRAQYPETGSEMVPSRFGPWPLYVVDPSPMRSV